MAKKTSSGNRLADKPQWFWQPANIANPDLQYFAPITTSFTRKDKVGILLHSVGIIFYEAAAASPLIAMVAPGNFVRWGITQLWRGGVLPPSVGDEGVIFENQIVLYADAATPGRKWMPAKYYHVFEEQLRPIVHPTSCFLYWEVPVAPAALFTTWMGFEYEYTDLGAEEYEQLRDNMISNAV